MPFISLVLIPDQLPWSVRVDIVGYDLCYQSIIIFGNSSPK